MGGVLRSPTYYIRTRSPQEVFEKEAHKDVVRWIGLGRYARALCHIAQYFHNGPPVLKAEKDESVVVLCSARPVGMVKARLLQAQIPGVQSATNRKERLLLDLTQKNVGGKLERSGPPQKGQGPCRRHNEHLRENLR